MWVMLSDAFLSIVSKDCHSDELLVRARRPGDIERVFPAARVTVSTDTDYMFRARVPRDEVACALADAAGNIDYDNFKNSVADHDLHSAYSKVWGAMAGLQPAPPYSGTRRTAGRRGRLA